MQVLDVLFVALAAFGHVALWIGIVNRWHGTGLPRPILKTVSALFYVALAAPAVWIGWHIASHGWSLPAGAQSAAGKWLVRTYLVATAAYGIAHVLKWTAWHLRPPPSEVEIGKTRVVDLAERLGAPPALDLRTRLASRLPGNQLWKLHVVESTITLARLPQELAGLSIWHWSDLHLAGRIDRGYFRALVELTNEQPADLLALTGDVCDRARYIDWIVELFADAQARLGKYFVLGNHDLRTHAVARLRAALVEAGFADLGGRAVTIAEGQLLLAGDERPWFRGEPDLPNSASHDGQLRVLLAHTPDRLAWARAHDFDLMLAGHTHGGQVRFPVVGAVLCPSLFGTKYSDGYYHDAPTTLHVSRGSASLFPVRVSCPPEITRLVLRQAPG